MKTIIESNENYSVIDLTLEYENWTGTERYAVISDFDQGYIEEMFASELSEYKPYIYMANAFLDIRRDFRNNNKKHEMRSIRSESVFSFEDSDTETHHKEISIPDFVEQWIENYELKEAIKKLTDKERERLFEYFYKDKTLTEIGDKAGCSPRAVKYSIDSAVKKIKTFFDSLLQK